MNQTNNSIWIIIPKPPPFNDWIFLYGCGPLSLASFILTSVCFVIFSDKVFKNMNLFIYFRLECAFMPANMLIKFLVLFICRPNWPIWPTLFSQLFYNYAFIYVSSVLEFCALGMNICAAAVCLSMLNPNNKILVSFANTSPYLVSAIWVVFSALFYFYQAVSRNIFSIDIFVKSARILG